jgi:hypothetical protein
MERRGKLGESLAPMEGRETERSSKPILIEVGRDIGRFELHG